MSRTKRSDTRLAILDAARALFEAHGYFSVGLEAVAKKAGVSRQAIYLHFDSKADLLRALHEHVNEQDVEPAFRDVWACNTADEALDAFVEASARVIPKIIGILNALNTARGVDRDAAATWQAPTEGRYGDCLRLAEWLEGEALLTPGVTAAHAADIIWSLASVRAYETLVVDRAWPSRQWVEWLRAALRRLLVRP